MELPKVDLSPEKAEDQIPKGCFFLKNNGSTLETFLLKRVRKFFFLDASTKKKITEIIDQQFDLEIYLKQREVATIKQQIAKAESILSDLKLAVENGIQRNWICPLSINLLFCSSETLAASMPEAAHYTRRSAMYYHGGPQALLNQPSISAPVKRKVYRTSEKSRLFGRRNDGVFVR